MNRSTEVQQCIVCQLRQIDFAKDQGGWGFATTNELYQTYKSIVKRPITLRAFSNALHKLHTIGIVEERQISSGLRGSMVWRLKSIQQVLRKKEEPPE